jgi:hypothetical protein
MIIKLKINTKQQSKSIKFEEQKEYLKTNNQSKQNVRN